MKPLEAIEDAGWLLVMGMAVPVTILIVGSTLALAARLLLWIIALL